MHNFEQVYRDLVQSVLLFGEDKPTRNQWTRSLFACTLKFDLHDKQVPILQGRQMFYKGVFGELAAMLHAGQEPLEHIDQLKGWGCNYWDKWADEEGYLSIDYGNAWFAGGQMDRLRDSLANNPSDRRMLITGWVPENLSELSLPCCHYAYQFYVANNTVHMLWNQRSADLMVGVPSDALFAAAWLISIANEYGYTPGTVTMMLGDTHIYKGHIPNAKVYLDRPVNLDVPIYHWVGGTKSFLEFEPSDIEIINYQHAGKLEFELYE